MNKSEIVEAIAKEAKLSKADSEKALDAFRSVVTKSLKKGAKVSLIGFFSVERVKRSARTARNPRTGKEIRVAAKNVAKFKAGKALNDSIK